MSTGQLYGEAFTAFLGNEYNCVPFCSACRMGRKQEELKVGIQLQSCKLVGIMGTLWNMICDWSVVTDWTL